MANKASDHIFRLIKTMSKPEKRYFKVYINRHTASDKNNNELLFDAMDKQEEYNEDLILEKFESHEFTKRFSITKSRLYQAILKSLDNFYSQRSVEVQVRRQLHFVEILYRKSLYDQSVKLLKSAKKQALKYELTNLLFDVIKWEKRFMELNNYENVSKEEIDRIWSEDHKLLDDLSTSSTLWYVKSKVFQQLYEKGKIRTKGEMANFKSVIDENIEELDISNLTVSNQYLINHLYSAFHFASGDYSESYNFLKKNIELIESNPKIFSEEPNIYLSVLTNAIHMSTTLDQKEEGFKYLLKLRNLSEQYENDWSEDLAIRYFAISKSAELTYYIENGDPDSGLNLVPEIREGLEMYKGKISSVRRGFFFFGIANLFFAKKDYHESLNWVNKLLNDVDIDVSTDLHCMGLLFHMVLHIELDHEDLLPYMQRSTERFLSTREKTYKFESLFLRFAKNLTKKRNIGFRDKLYKELSKESSKLKKDPFEARAFEYFDFQKWAENKIVNKEEKV